MARYCVCVRRWLFVFVRASLFDLTGCVFYSFAGQVDESFRLERVHVASGGGEIRLRMDGISSVESVEDWLCCVRVGVLYLLGLDASVVSCSFRCCVCGVVRRLF